jgi:hypothetical protein
VVARMTTCTVGSSDRSMHRRGRSGAPNKQTS